MIKSIELKPPTDFEMETRAKSEMSLLLRQTVDAAPADDQVVIMEAAATALWRRWNTESIVSLNARINELVTAIRIILILNGVLLVWMLGGPAGIKLLIEWLLK